MKKLLAVLLSVMMLVGTVLPVLAENSVKDETVYVLAKSDGSARKIIVSDWLSNPNESQELNDVSRLLNIENVKGNESFVNGIWQAAGQEIYYQGESTDLLPVEMKITYALDGHEISPEALAGESGHVSIRFDFSVNATANVLVNDQQEEIRVPFAVLTAALLENDVFTNIEASNARIINDGDHTVVVGLTLPGMQESLKLDKALFSLPESIELEADVKNFSLPVTVTLATDELFGKLDVEQLHSMDDLKQAMSDLNDGMLQLLDGSTLLHDGLNELDQGAVQVADGVAALSDGLNELTANNEALISGSAQVFETLLAAANQQIAASGTEVPALSIENYAQVLFTLIDSMSAEGIAEQAYAQIEQAVRAQEEQVRTAVTQAVQTEVSAQVETAVQENVLEQILATVNMTLDDYQAAKDAEQLPAEQVKQLESALEQQMASSSNKSLIAQNTEEQMNSDSVQALIAAKTDEQLQALIEQNMASGEVQKQIAQTAAQYQASSDALTALKEQLDRYNSFHAGLIAYTEGAASASEGAAELKAHMPALLEGIRQLEDGALSLKEGLDVFNTNGIEKLSTLVNEDLNALMERIHGLIEAAKDYQNYSGITEEMSGKVRFIWRTDAIEP